MDRDGAPHGGHLDEAGRVVIPAAVRRELFWGPGTPVVVEAVGPDRVVVRRADTHCLFCHTPTPYQVLGRPVCRQYAAVIAAGWLP